MGDDRADGDGPLEHHLVELAEPLRQIRHGEPKRLGRLVAGQHRAAQREDAARRVAPIGEETLDEPERQALLLEFLDER